MGARGANRAVSAGGNASVDMGTTWSRVQCLQHIATAVAVQTGHAPVRRGQIARSQPTPSEN
jgi:transcriptional regulator GlxA family with amidase domain